ncbi:MAG: OmpH family outer membrane protein, partial [Bacteroidales bacterium]|nr:OmpH family outer membrane protein [Bacteroidales bacterium]
MMKRMTLAVAILSMAVVLHAQKFGHVNSEVLLQAMPEFDTAQMKVQELRQHYELEIERIQVEINKKIEEFNQSESTMSDLIKEAKASEIQELQMRLQNYSQTAQQDLQQQSTMMIQPVMEKARNAIDEVAKEHGLIYVFDISQGNPVYTSEESLDLVPLVKAKLGL